MKQYILILLIFLVGCQQIVCETPYIRFEQSCCLDTDSNLVCDEDEKVEEFVEIKVVDEKKVVEKEIVEEKEVEEKEETVEEKKSFDVEIEYLKGTIRLVDQAIIHINIVNNEDYLETFLVNIDDERWIIRSDPYMYPMRVGVKGGGKNHIKLIMQPNKNSITEKGDYTVDIEVKSEKVSETINTQVDIKIS